MRVRLSSPIDQVRPRYDVVVVGSGYGGAIAASRLARAGRKVCVLERGRELQPGEYPDNVAEATRELQVTSDEGHVGSRTGLYDLRLGKDICVFLGCGLGGTSLVNANVSLRPDPRVLDDARWPAAVRSDVARLGRAFALAEEMLKPAPYPRDTAALAKLAALERSAAQMGGRFYKTPINVTFEEPPAGVNHVGVEQHACNGCGDCVSGCNYGAKNTVLMNYLPDAMNFGAEIFCEAAVQHVARAEGGWRVYYQVLDAFRERFGAPPLFVSADLVVLAAGTLGSTEILLRSRAAGLSLSPALGQRFSGNGDVLGWGYDGEVPIHTVGAGHRDPALLKDRTGPCITGVIDARGQGDLERGYVVEDGSIPGALAPALPGAFEAAARVGDVPFRPTVAQRARELESALAGSRVGAMDSTQTYLVMSHDDAAGTMRLDDDRLRIDWPGVGRQPHFARMNDAMRRASLPLGAFFVKDPLSSRLAGQELITVHPLGGCAMADDAASGVVNHKGQVFSGASGDAAHQGLYVVDGSIIPRSLGVNPLLTISALAERCCMIIAEEHDWRIDYSLPSRPQRRPALPKLAIEFTETMRGFFSEAEKVDFGKGEERGRREGSSLSFTLTIGGELDRLLHDPDHPARMAGTVLAPTLSPKPLAVSDGQFQLFVKVPEQVEARQMRYRMTLTSEAGERWSFEGVKEVHADGGAEVWHDTSTLFVTLRKDADDGPLVGRGILHIEPADFAKQLTTMQVKHAADDAQRLEALLQFGRYFAGALFDVYGGAFKRLSELKPDAAPRKRRLLRAPGLELHPFRTADGVDLRLARYRGGDKGPVILTHGFGVSGRIFALDTVHTCLVEYLCAAGYDVWNLENRASIDLPASAQQFDLDAVARFDYPAAVAKVQRVTGRGTVQMVAHCFGATTYAMSQLSVLRGVRAAVCSQIAAHVVVPLVTRVKSGLHLPDVLDRLGVHKLTASPGPKPRWLDDAVDELLRLTPLPAAERCQSTVCHRITFLYGRLYDHKNLDDLTHATLHETFGAGNMKGFEHLALLARRHRVVRADGGDDYLAHPERMKIPVAFIHGADNVCFLPESTELTYHWLQEHNGDLYSRHVIPGYGHIDCIMGREAWRDVYPYILDHLEATQSDEVVAQWVATGKRPAAAAVKAEVPRPLSPATGHAPVTVAAGG